MANDGQRENDYNVSSILELIYEMQEKAKLPFFLGIIPATIPIVLTTINVTNPYTAYAISPTSNTPFSTCYFRIEEVTHSLVHLSLLYPFDIEGNYLDTPEFPYGLRKTESTITVPIQNFCSIQCLNPNLIDRQIIIVGDK